MEEMYKLKELKEIYNAIDDKLGIDIKVIDIDKISSLTNYFIIATAKNQNQMEAIAENVDTKLKNMGVTLMQGEGYGSNWILQDFGFCMVHIFEPESREMFNLERLWTDGEIVENDLLVG